MEADSFQYCGVCHEKIDANSIIYNLQMNDNTGLNSLMNAEYVFDVQHICPRCAKRIYTILKDEHVPMTMLSPLFHTRGDLYDS